MKSRLKIVPVVCFLLLPACQSDNQKRLLIDPDRRPFELPENPQVLFFVDGLRADALEELRAAGKLPRLEKYLFGRAARVRSMVVSVPSVTYANAATMLTGCWPSAHGVWGNVCFDRGTLLARNFEDMHELADADVARPTIFELLGEELTASVALPFRSGCKIFLAASVDSGGESAWIAWLLGQEEFTDQLLGEQVYEIGEQATRLGEWPAFLAIHLPAVDDAGHEAGSGGEEYRTAIVNLDEAIGEVLEAFDDGGMLDDLTVVLTSDHGHLPTPRFVPLADLLQNALGVPLQVYAKNDGELEYVERWERCSALRLIATVTGERQASLHLRPGDRWKDRPNLEQALAFPGAAGGLEPTLPELLLASPAIDLVAVRAGEHEVALFARGGTATIRRSVPEGGGEPAYTYMPQTGEDPLGYGAELRGWIEAGAHTSREWLAATADERHPDLVPQLVLAFDHPRSGDVMLFAAPDWDFSEKYAGGHGGIEREEMIVPLYIAGPGIRAGAELASARLVDLVPTLLELAGARVAETQRFDGQSFAPSLRGAAQDLPYRADTRKPGRPSERALE